MDESAIDEKSIDKPQKGMSIRYLLSLLCASVIIFCLLACIFIAIQKSEALTQVRVTALKETVEPKDHDLPFIKQKEAKPDYEIIVNKNDGDKITLGCKIDTFAKETLVWDLSDPVALSSISSVRLAEKDAVISDTIAEVQITKITIAEKGYEFEFETESYFSVGLYSFYETPIGKAIAVGIILAIVILIGGNIGPFADVF